MRTLVTLLLWSIGISGVTAELSVVAVREYKYGRVFFQKDSCATKDSSELGAGCVVELTTVTQWEELPH